MHPECTDRHAHDHLCEDTQRVAPNANRDSDPNHPITISLILTVIVILSITQIVRLLSQYPTTAWAPESKQELEATIAQCLELSPTDCSEGPHGPIGSWDISAITDMESLFKGPAAEEFDGDISEWDVSSVTKMSKMFKGASSFARTLCDACFTSTVNKESMSAGFTHVSLQ